LALVSVNGVSKAYMDKGDVVNVLKGVTFDMERATFYSLFGPSGAGKTTLLNMISGLDEPDNGEVWFEGYRFDDLNESSKAKLRASSIGLIFQNPNLVSHLTSLENVILPTFFGIDGFENFKTIGMSLLERLGLKDKINKLPARLSEGERRRVSVARALVTEPKMILADEPTINLDSENSNVVLSLLKEAVERGASTLVATHDENIARLSDQTLRISFGTVHSDKIQG
jgi:putative ABC transport system ATP-binding protein